MDQQNSALANDLQQIVNGSSLADEEKALIINRLSLLDDDTIEILINLYKKDSSSLEKVIKFAKLKISSQGNDDNISKIIDTELEELNSAIKEDEISAQLNAQS